MYIDLINNTPGVYTQESRDFQLFLRLYEASLNSVKNDIDLASFITDTKNCKTEILPLLQTKVGFQSNHTFTSEMLRNVLRGFPEIIKNKGSFAAVKGALSVFLKTLGIKSDLLVYYSEDGQISFTQNVNDHTIVVGINEAIDNYYVLEELFKYILPAGFGFQFFFYKRYNRDTFYRDLSNANILFVGEEFASKIRHDILPYDSTKTYNTNDNVTYRIDAVADPNSSGLYEVYKCIDDNVTGEWDSSKWIVDSVVNNILNAVDTTSIYSLFETYNSASTYDIGDQIIYQGNLYECLEATTGEWDSSKWKLIENRTAYNNLLSITSEQGYMEEDENGE